MVKRAEKKPDGGSTNKKARNGSHIKTFCGWCDKQIARGMSYCNKEHRRANMNFRGLSRAESTKEE